MRYFLADILLYRGPNITNSPSAIIPAKLLKNKWVCDKVYSLFYKINFHLFFIGPLLHSKRAPFCMVKDALLNCKRRPFTSQNMPFYKSICNLLVFRLLQAPFKTTFIHFRLYHSFPFCKYILPLNLPVILYSLLRLSSNQTGRILSDQHL